ncbi:4Fe-4S dicluster domain-containing protein [Anaeromyxobacter paludicola]|uniref:4Fe-4S ferredoxin-type domain-containing protein n=1 Tax=Anaeromyxobacter paludicola TaxID=2918171 RepID=A0ABN6N5G1_9BACT|nr:4Fe-4S dicluster domain-containing protein [Anaeromyxobacter paludicola]BDG07338.1 hypothetical protein AMPC_04510 [Anaeromyxobacter paludicola]
MASGGIAMLIDISRCTGCKGCQAACMQWNGQRGEVGRCTGTLQNPADLSATMWTVLRYSERLVGGRMRLLPMKDGCKHCEKPACQEACQRGAIVQHDSGLVEYRDDRCVGCGYCVDACSFAVPRMSPGPEKKARKCNFCKDRLDAGQLPACVKTCPTRALSFGTKEQMLAKAEARMAELRQRGFPEPALYDPESVNGTHVMYVLPLGWPEQYGLPNHPVPRPYARKLRQDLRGE